MSGDKSSPMAGRLWNKEKLRILIAPEEIAGYYTSLASGLREAGAAVEFLELTSHPFGYGGATRLPPMLRAERALANNSHLGLPGFRKLIRLIAYSIRFIWLIGSLHRYDVFIFSYGRSFMPGNFDLPIIRLARKKIICNLFHGSEARPPYLDGWQIGMLPQTEQLRELKRVTLKTQARVQRCEKWATWVIGAPFSSSPFLTKPFINFFFLGLPTKFEAIEEDIPFKKRENENRATILHSPSNPRAKGTEEIRATVDALIAQGMNLTFIELTGVSNSEVIENLRRCDFVVDELYSDTPMAGFAAEAASLGKPAIVSGERLSDLRTWVKKENWPPTVTCKPEELGPKIAELALNPILRRQIGESSRKFVTSMWNPTSVAQKYLQIISGNFPDEWLMSPRSVTFLAGTGMSEENQKRWSRSLANEHGISALGLDHRPDLLVNFASS